MAGHLLDRSIPSNTRLRRFEAKSSQEIEDLVNALGVRIQIYGAPVFDGKRWTLWFVPNDKGADIKSVRIS
jgi:hypothetical protein